MSVTWLGECSSDCCGQNAQADVLLHRLHYALPVWGAAAERRGAQGEQKGAAQARAWADGDFDADHGLGLGGPAPPHTQNARSEGRVRVLGGGDCCAASLIAKAPLQKKSCHALDDLYGQDPVRNSDGFDGMYNEGDSDGLDYY
jgi:hypothetical protein